MAAPIDPADALSRHLSQGEQVLWNGRPGFGISRHDRRRIVRGWLTVCVTLMLLQLACFSPVLVIALREGGGVVLAFLIAFVVQSVVPATIGALAVTLAHLAGGAAFPIGVIIVVGPLMALVWGTTLQEGGLQAAMQWLSSPVTVFFLVVLALAALQVTLVVVKQLNTRYFLTSRQAIELRMGRRTRLQWRTPISTGWLQFRVVHPFGARRRGHIAVGTGQRRKLLRWLADPEGTLEEIKQALGEDAFESGPPRRSPPLVELTPVPEAALPEAALPEAGAPEAGAPEDALPEVPPLGSETDRNSDERH